MDPKAEFDQFLADLKKQLLDPKGTETDAETLRSLGYLEKELRRVWKEIESNPNPSDLALALHNLARYAGWLLLILEEGLGSPIEFQGWISRGLFELYLLTRYVLNSDQNLHAFLGAAATDEIMMLDGILQLPEAAPEAHAKLRERVQVLKTERIASIQLPNCAIIAEEVGVKGEYDAFWKLYSKYVHPSSWVINQPAQLVRNAGYQKVFLMQAQFNAQRVLKLAESNCRRQEPGQP